MFKVNMGKSLRRILLAGSAIAFGMGANANAAEVKEPINALDEGEIVVVTASSRAQKINDVQASVEVITRKQIDKFAGSSVTQALSYSVGVDARSSGSNSSVTIRGLSGNDALILFDGVPRTAKYGSSNLNNYAVEDVERVEIIRGPMSALYGANASAGVVNIITKPVGVGPRANLSTTYYATNGNERSGYVLAGSVRIGDEHFGHRISIDYHNADPFKFNQSATSYDLIGVEHTSLTYTGELHPAINQKLKWTLEAFKQDDKAQNYYATTKTYYSRFEEETRYYGGLQYVGDLGIGELTLDANYSTSDGSANRSYPIVETTKFNQTNLQAKYAIDLGAQKLLFGTGYRIDDLAVSINSVKADRENLFAFAQDEVKLPFNLNLLLGVRYDDFNEFGDSINPRVSVGYNNQNGLFARVGYGTAFRAPTVLEQYSRFTRGRFIIMGSPDLKPEEDETYEIAAGWRTKKFGIEANYYSSDIKKMIESYQPGTTINGLVVSQYINRASAEISGSEFIAYARPMKNLEFNASYETIDAVDGTTKARLTGRYKSALKLSASVKIQNLDITFRHRALYDIWGADSAVRGSAPFASDFAVSDLIFNLNLQERHDISVGFNNLGNQRVPVNYTSTGSIEDPPGSNFYIKLRTKF